MSALTGRKKVDVWVLQRGGRRYPCRGLVAPSGALLCTIKNVGGDGQGKFMAAGRVSQRDAAGVRRIRGPLPGGDKTRPGGRRRPGRSVDRILDHTESWEIWREGGARAGRWALWMMSGVPASTVIRLVVLWASRDGLKQLSPPARAARGYSNPQTRLHYLDAAAERLSR